MEDKNNYKRPESVLVIVHTKTGYVLVMRRVNPDDFWQSVTGSLEWGELAFDAAVRELKEETGLDGADLVDCNFSQEFEIYSMWRQRYQPGVTHNIEHVFTLELEDCRDIQIDPREHIEYRWLPRDEAIAQASSHTNRHAIVRWVPR